MYTFAARVEVTDGYNREGNYCALFRVGIGMLLYWDSSLCLDFYCWCVIFSFHLLFQKISRRLTPPRPPSQPYRYLACYVHSMHCRTHDGKSFYQYPYAQTSLPQMAQQVEILLFRWELAEGAKGHASGCES